MKLSFTVATVVSLLLTRAATTEAVVAVDDTTGGSDPQTAMNELEQLAAEGNTPVEEQVVRQPAQTFYIPLPEEQLFQETFKAINSADSKPPVHNLISIVISSDDTVLFFDHWEDGFDALPTLPDRASTEIWGDGNAANGCPPQKNGAACTDASDKLMAGQSIVLQSVIPAAADRAKTETGTFAPLHDGGDRITSTLPIAVTRAAYPDAPGSLLAGGVEILDTDSWGMEFVAPVGEDVSTDTDSFEYSAIYVMAKDANTTVQHYSWNNNPKGSPKLLQRGESVSFRVRRNEKIKADKPVQADLLTGDINDIYEMRWFSLLDVQKWTSDYYSPVGDSVGKTKIVLYNPGSEYNDKDRIRIEYEYLSKGPGSSVITRTLNLNSRNHVFTDVVPTGSGMRIKADGKFFALSVTDTLVTAAGNHGQVYDWGFPVMPATALTPQVIIGLGYGCTDNICVAEGRTDERSVVWVSALEDAWVHLDFNNDGVDDALVFQTALEGKAYTDTTFNDKDMSGALIYATKEESVDSEPVSIAAAWGQDPARSSEGDPSAMDLGTLVVPFSTVRVKKFMNLKVDLDRNLGYSRGDTVEFVIEVVNVGQVAVDPKLITIVDDDMTNCVYIPGTFVYEYGTEGKTFLVNDDGAPGTPFPLDGKGIKNPVAIDKRGGTHRLSFQCRVPSDASGTIKNSGYITQPLMPKQKFEVEEPIVEPLTWTRSSESPCLQENWEDHGKTSTLQCTTKDVFITQASAHEPKACEVGKPITLSLNAKINLKKDVYDLGWYVALQGGDGMEGNCALGMLDQDYASSMRVVRSEGSNILHDTATVQWGGDVGNDECGDVKNVGQGAAIDYNLAIDSTMICQDSTGDGKMDFNICFGWSTEEKEGLCNLKQRLANGNAPDLLPGDTGSCFCSTVKIRNVLALDPGDKVYPC